MIGDIILLFAFMAAPSYDVSAWNLAPSSIPRINAVGGVPAGFPVVSGGGIVTGPDQVSGSVENLLTYSENLSATPWTVGGAQLPVVVADQAISPDGTLSADEVNFPAVSSGWSLIYQHNVGSGPRSFSAWMRSSSGTATIWIMGTTVGTAFDRTACNLTTSWSRCSVITSMTYLQIGIDLRDASQSSKPAQSVYIWGAQVEAVGDLSAPGPYVATSVNSASGTRGEYNGHPSDPGILVPVHISDPKTWGVGVSAAKASWDGADALVDIGGQLSGMRWNSARLETTAGGALVFTVISSTGASATRTVAAHNFLDGSTHKLAFGAFDGTPFLLVDGVSSGTLSGTAVLSSFPATIGINSTVHPVAKTVYRVSQGPTPWAAHHKLK